MKTFEIQKVFVPLRHINMGIMKRLLYCLLWSGGLWVSSFYTMAQSKDVFVTTNKPVMDMLQGYMMPMIMVMALYVLDVAYSILLKRENNFMKTVKILGFIVLFLIAFVFSMLVNNNYVGWLLFGVAWLMLTALKYVTTDDVNLSSCKVYKVSED